MLKNFGRAGDFDSDSQSDRSFLLLFYDFFFGKLEIMTYLCNGIEK